MVLVQNDSSESSSTLEDSPQTTALTVATPEPTMEQQCDLLERSRQSITWRLLQNLSPANQLLLYIILGSETSREFLFEQLEFNAKYSSQEFDSVGSADLQEDQLPQLHPARWFVVGALATIAVLFCGRTFAFLLDPPSSCSPTEQQVSPINPPLSKAGG